MSDSFLGFLNHPSPQRPGGASRETSIENFGKDVAPVNGPEATFSSNFFASTKPFASTGLGGTIRFGGSEEIGGLGSRNGPESAPRDATMSSVEAAPRKGQVL